MIVHLNVIFGVSRHKTCASMRGVSDCLRSGSMLGTRNTQGKGDDHAYTQLGYARMRCHRQPA